MKQKLDEHKDDLFYYMIFCRIMPGTPNWLMNISMPHLQINELYFVSSIFIGFILVNLTGLSPYNFLVCSAGVMISTLKSKEDIMGLQNYLWVLFH